MKKFLGLLIGVCLAVSFATAQQSETAFGTKPDVVVAATPAEKAAPLVDGWQFAQMIGAVAIVFCLVKFGLPRLLGKVGNKLVSSENGSIQVRESCACGSATLQVVEVRGKSLLLAVGAQGVTFLTDVTSNAKTQDEPAFFELVDKKKSATTIYEDAEREKSRSNALIESLNLETSASPSAVTKPSVTAAVEPLASNPKVADVPATETPRAQKEQTSDEFEESLRLLKEAKQRMEQRKTGVQPEAVAAPTRSERLSRLIG